jgi:hypothetical protein
MKTSHGVRSGGQSSNPINSINPDPIAKGQEVRVKTTVRMAVYTPIRTIYMYMEISPNKVPHPVGTIVSVLGKHKDLEGTIGEVQRIKGRIMFIRFPWPDFKTVKFTPDQVTTCNEVKYLKR